MRNTQLDKDAMMADAISYLTGKVKRTDILKAIPNW
jgi:hypothetical protein